jgi:hypothetical protein
MLNVTVPNVVMLSVMLNVVMPIVMLNVVMPSVVMLGAIILMS